MNSFTLSLPTEVIFGKDTELQVGEVLLRHGAHRVLLHYGGGSIKQSGLYDRVIESLKGAGLSWVELGGVSPNPLLGMVRQGVEICRRSNIDFVLAVGGGSAIDSAKAISVGARYEGDVWDFYSGIARPQARIALGVIGTFPAAGSETSNSSVITNEETATKRGCRSELFRPVFSIMNPELTYTLPPYQTACGITDMFTHVAERYFTNTGDVDFSDMMCEAAMKTIIKHAPVVMADPQNYASRAELYWVSSVAHNELLNAGRQDDWASHQIAHELSGRYNVAHGAALAVVMPAWMQYVYRHDIMRFCRFAVEVFGVPMDYFHPEQTARAGIAAFRRFLASIGMPGTLADLNIGKADLHDMAAAVKKNNAAAEKTGHFVPLGPDDIEAIYLSAQPTE